MFLGFGSTTSPCWKTHTTQKVGHKAELTVSQSPVTTPYSVNVSRESISDTFGMGTQKNLKQQTK